MEVILSLIALIERISRYYSLKAMFHIIARSLIIDSMFHFLQP